MKYKKMQESLYGGKVEQVLAYFQTFIIAYLDIQILVYQHTHFLKDLHSFTESLYPCMKSWIRSELLRHGNKFQLDKCQTIKCYIDGCCKDCCNMVKCQLNSGLVMIQSSVPGLGSPKQMSPGQMLL